MTGADRRQFLVGACALALASAAEAKGAAAPHLTATRRAEIPRWARLQRKLLDTNAAACRAFYDKYFDARGWLMAYPRWGANDGPDDAIENFNDWPLLHMLGASDEVKALYTRGWNGHINQYSQARTTEVEFGRNGMYRKEFLTMSDWQHHGEGMTLFAMAGLSDPRSPDFLRRARTYAGFYMGDDPAAPNWDPEHRLIRSLLNGSLGPLLRPATPLDWAGDPFNADGFKLEHGEDSYPQMLEHFRDYGEVVGDHPLNLVSTTLAFNAYMATGERRYRDWVISYVDAWVERAARNGGVLPSNVGLDGSIGGAAGGRWWGGAYGWGFSPVNPATGKREDRNRVPRAIIGFMNAYLLTGDDKYLQVWRTQADVINAQSKMIDGRLCAPWMHGAEGWYGYAPGPYNSGVLELFHLTRSTQDRARAGSAIDHPWLAYLDGRDPSWPERALEADLAHIDTRLARMAADHSKPEARLADNALEINPAAVTALLHQTVGAIHIARPPWAPSTPNAGGAPLYSRLRHFDPVRRRAGLPEDVSALVEAMSDRGVVLTLVNSGAVARRVTVQAGGYGEHRFSSLRVDGRTAPIDGRVFTLTLAPGAVARVEAGMQLHVNQPTLAFPWDRSA